MIENTKFQKVWFQIKQEKQNKQIVINLKSEQQAEEREERAGESGKVRKSSTNFHAPRAGKGHVKPRTNAVATAVNNIARAQHHTTRCWTKV